MYWDDCYYCEEPKYPEVEELLEDVTNKITEIIRNDVKEDIEISLNAAKNRETELSQCKDRLHSRDIEISNLEKRVEELEKEVDKKHTELTLPFEIGEEIWVAAYNSSYKLTCNTCKGTGRININTEQYGEVQISCPHCKGFTLSNRAKREVTYYKYIAHKTTVKSISCNITSDGISYDIHYTDQYHDDQVRELEKCFSNKDDCITFCEEYNKQCYEQALESLEGEEDKKE